MREKKHEKKAICTSCGSLYNEDDIIPLAEVKGLAERLTPGEEVPAGECPDLECGALVYLDDDSTYVGRLFNCARLLIDLVNATGGCIKDAKGFVVPKCDEDWIDLGEAYVKACEALGEKPKMDLTEDEILYGEDEED